MASNTISSSSPTLSSQHSRTLISSLTTSYNYKCCSSLCSLQQHFPLKLRGFSISRSRQPSRILPLIQAKKQTFSNLDELLSNSDKPVLVDFYATWCGPCQFMIPIMEQVNATLKDKVLIVKIDTERYPEIADKYKIEALPTFILFKDGEPCDRFEGALPADKLVQRIESSLTVKS